MTPALNAEVLGAVSQTVEARFALCFPPERWTDLERGLRSAAAELGYDDAEEYAHAVVHGPLASAETRALAAQLTIGETYFFRDPVAFTTLRTLVLPALVEEKRGRARRLRIWSAGCCTGEEPYSIAITLQETLPDIDEWQITILATDLNPHFLAQAAAGAYGQWSFRGVPEETRRAWFRRLPDGRHEVAPRVRQMVTFASLNLAEPGWPSHATQTTALDLIFCRNVLMYFSPERAQQVVAGLHRALVVGGRLLVSASEASREMLAGFALAEVPGVALYRKSAPPRSAPATAAPSLPPPAAPPAPELPPDHAADARRLADEGRLDAALAACDRALAAEKLRAALHYLRGVILQEQNAPDSAATAFRRALDLDPAFTLAHFTLGHLLLGQGRPADAAHCFSQARTLLRACPPETVLPESEGLTAGRLLTMLAAHEEPLA